jgi:hypothetical protein
MGGPCSKNGVKGDEYWMLICVWEYKKEKDHSEDKDV